MTWNIDNGGEDQTTARYQHIIQYLIVKRPMVVGIIEAVNWGDRPRDGVYSRRRLIEEHDDNIHHLNHTNDPSWTYQTKEFRNRAAAAGYAYSRLLFTKYYHLALLSTAPIYVIFEDHGKLMQRGLLVADSHGVRWMISHFHAQSPSLRSVETKFVNSLVEKYTFGDHAMRNKQTVIDDVIPSDKSIRNGYPHVPLILAGDFNSLSSVDSSCHVLLRVAEYLQDASTPEFLRKKFLKEAGDQSGTKKIDYEPILNLLNGRVYAGGRGYLFDETFPNGVLPLMNQSGIGCRSGGTVPTKLFTDDSKESSMPPLRIDNVYSNEPFRTLYSPSACKIMQDDPTLLLASDHFPIFCEWLRIEP
jgi:endonuclease/exonuclease/phosphatase family metal-dependent hydrolase